MCVVRGRRRRQHGGTRCAQCSARLAPRLQSNDGLAAGYGCGIDVLVGELWLHRLLATQLRKPVISVLRSGKAGTPAGVGMGMAPPEFLKEGDLVEMSITGLGTQRHTETAE